MPITILYDFERCSILVFAIMKLSSDLFVGLFLKGKNGRLIKEHQEISPLQWKNTGCEKYGRQYWQTITIDIYKSLLVINCTEVQCYFIFLQ